jgi:hypothetical protein
MSNKNALIYITLTFLVFANNLHAMEVDIIKSEIINVHYEKPLRKVALEVIRLFPIIKQELEETFNTKLGFTPTVVLIKDSRAFQRIAGNKSIVAMAISKEKRIIIDNSKMKTHSFTLKVTLKHELCHLFLSDYVQGGRMPKWLNEGISQWLSDGIAEIIIGSNKNLLKRATLSNKLIPLKDMERAFPSERRSLLLAYEESRSIVGYLVNKFGFTRILLILNYLSEGFEIDAALRAEAGISLHELEQKWKASLRRQTSWFSFMSTHLYQILFIFAALILTYGFIRVLVKKWNYRDEDGEEV